MASATPSLDELLVLKRGFEFGEYGIIRVQLPNNQPDSSKRIPFGYLLGRFEDHFAFAIRVRRQNGMVTPTSRNAVHYVSLSGVERPVYWEPEKHLLVEEIKDHSDRSYFPHRLTEILEIEAQNNQGERILRIVHPEGRYKRCLYYVIREIRHESDTVIKGEFRFNPLASENSLHRRMPSSQIIDITKLKRIQERYEP